MPERCNAERVLTARELNRAVLARQHLLEPSAGSITTTLAAVGGLQAQYAPSMYVGLWSRMGDLDVPRRRRRRRDLEAPRREGRAAVVSPAGPRDAVRAARGGRPARGVSRVTGTSPSATSVRHA